MKSSSAILDAPSGGETIIDGELVRGPARPERLRVSVVLATYNRPERLLGVIAQLDAQVGVEGLEIVVVDDGGSVSAIETLKERPSSLPLRVLRRSNGGPGPARDTGISQAIGDIVLLLDDDMSIGPSFVAQHVQAHDDGADVVLGHIYSPDQADLALFERFHLDSLARFVVLHQDGKTAPVGVHLCTGNVSFRRDAYHRVGGFDLSLRRCEDRDLGLRFEVAGYRFAFCVDARSEHRTDHDDAAEWRSRSRLFGRLDARIAEKHPMHATASPWAFLPKLPMPIRPLLIGSACVPRAGRAFAGLIYFASEHIDRWSSSSKRRLARFGAKLAMIGASMTYAMDYFAGVGDSFSSRNPQQVLASHRRHKTLQVGT